VVAAMPGAPIFEPRRVVGVGSAVLAAISPETVRGLQPDYRTADVYAAGALFRWLLKRRLCPVPPRAREAQARNAAFADDPEVSVLEPFLHGLDAVSQLVETMRRYTHHIGAGAPPIRLRADESLRRCIRRYRSVDAGAA